MNLAFPGILASLLYVASAGLQVLALSERMPSKKNLVVGTGILALIAHAWFSWQEIFTANGINMGIFPMASVTCLVIAALLIISSLRRPVENLMIVLFPVIAVFVGMSLMLPDTYTPRNRVSMGIAVHIILSVIAYGLLTIAAFQALLLSFGDYELRHRKLSLLRHLPPLQTMDALLFEILWAGLIFLSLSIATGFIFLRNNVMAIPGLLHHTTITLAAWIVFAILLSGRYRRGWRGAIASRWTLAGFALLALGYLGSKFVLEIILGRA